MICVVVLVYVLLVTEVFVGVALCSTAAGHCDQLGVLVAEAVAGVALCNAKRAIG